MSKELKVRTAFVEKAYDAAGNDWKQRIEKEFRASRFKGSNLDCLQRMVKECFEANRYNYHYLNIDDGDIRVVNIDDKQFYVVVKLPIGNTDWTLSAFDFIRDFLKVANMYDVYPAHDPKVTKEISKKIPWDVERYIPISVTFNNQPEDKQEFLITSEEFVKEAYDAACADWKKLIAAEFPELFKTEEKYPLGTRLMIHLSSGEEECMIAGIGEKAYVFCVNNGNVWTSSRHMNIVHRKVSYTELSLYIGSTPFHIL